MRKSANALHQDWITLSNQSEKAYPERGHDLWPAKVVELLGDAKLILAVGRFAADFVKLLSTDDRVVTVVDMHTPKVCAAAPFCSRALIVDLENDRLSTLLQNERFDAAIFADVLGQLQDHSRLFDDVRSLLQPNGFAVMTVLNGGHGAFRLARLSDAFDDATIGPSGGPHLRRFTAQSLEDFFVCSGYEIDRIERTTLPLFETSEVIPLLSKEAYPELVIARLREDPDVETLRFIVRARALDDATKLARIMGAYAYAQNQLRSAQEARSMRDLEDALTTVTLEHTHIQRLKAQPEHVDGSERDARHTVHTQIEETNSRIRALRELHQGCLDELFRVRQTWADLAHTVRERKDENAVLRNSLKLACAQIDLLTERSIALEAFCGRLLAREARSDSRAADAEHELWRFMREFADDFGNVSSVTASQIANVRAAFPSLLTQIETAAAAAYNVGTARQLQSAGEKVPPSLLKLKTVRRVSSFVEDALRRMR